MTPRLHWFDGGLSCWEVYDVSGGRTKKRAKRQNVQRSTDEIHTTRQGKGVVGRLIDTQRRRTHGTH